MANEAKMMKEVDSEETNFNHTRIYKNKNHFQIKSNPCKRERKHFMVPSHIGIPENEQGGEFVL